MHKNRQDVDANFTSRQFCTADFALTNLTKFRQNRYFRQADFALTNLAKVRQNRQLHSGNSCCNLHKNRRNRQIRQHVRPISGDAICRKIVSLTKFRQICHFSYCLHFWTFRQVDFD